MEKPTRIAPSNSPPLDEEPSNSVSRTRLSNCRADPAPMETWCPGPSSSKDRTVQGIHNFRKSGPPSRIFFFENNNWVEFPKQVFDELTACFSTGNLAFELSDGGNDYLFHFPCMVRIDMLTEARSSIAWIDDKDKCFFPDVTESEIAERIDKVRSMGEESSNSVSRTCLSNCRADPSSSKDRTVQEIHNFRKSGPPSRIFFCENDNWVEFPKQVFDKLTACFSSGNLVFELSAGGNNYLFDILHMFRIDMLTEARSLIAWIDDKDQCFFPDVTESEIAERNDMVRSMGCSCQMISQRGKVVENLFLNGMRKLAPNTIVTKVYNCPPSDLFRSKREKNFLLMLDMAREARKDANLKFGWYGASWEDVISIVRHGFGYPNTDMLEFGGHGHGVHLSPQHAPYASSCLSRADSKGERHILLCRVIMGNPERVEVGSAQCHPSNENFDSGVDNLENPKWYIVWNTRMNTHILPKYVVSFKSFNKPQGLMGAVTSARMGTGPEMSRVEELLSALVGFLPSSHIRALEMLHNDVKVGRIQKPAFISHLRSLVGDGLLCSTIKRLRLV